MNPEGTTTYRRCPNCYTVLKPDEKSCWVCLEGPDLITYLDAEVVPAQAVQHQFQNHAAQPPQPTRSGGIANAIGMVLTGVAISLGSVAIGAMIAVIAIYSFVVSIFESCAGQAFLQFCLFVAVVLKCVHIISLATGI